MCVLDTNLTPFETFLRKKKYFLFSSYILLPFKVAFMYTYTCKKACCMNARMIAHVVSSNFPCLTLVFQSGIKLCRRRLTDNRTYTYIDSYTIISLVVHCVHTAFYLPIESKFADFSFMHKSFYIDSLLLVWSYKIVTPHGETRKKSLNPNPR